MVDRVLNEGGQNKISVQGIKEAKTAATTTVGSVKELAYGRAVIYCQCSTAAAIAQGVTVQGPALVANHAQRPVAITASIGATAVTITIGATSASKDLYANGYLLITCGTNSGDMYKIAGHAAWAASSTAAKVLLKDGLEKALNTASIVHLVQNEGQNVITVPAAGPTGKFLGIALCSASAGYFFYVGSKGVWPALVGSGTITGGCFLITSCAASSLDNGGTAIVTGLHPEVGVALTSATNSSGAYFVASLK